MGKLGRFACIFLPMAMTIASFICLTLVMSGQLNKDNKVQRDLYFFKADTREFSDKPLEGNDLPDIPGELDNDLLKALQGSAKDEHLKDFYLIGLWNYCSGDVKGDKEEIKYCSDRTNYFWFNPIEEWNLTNKDADNIFSDEFNKGLDTYHKVSRWMFASYVIAWFLTIAEFLVGISAIFSRWGSFVTTIVSTAQSVFVFAAAVTSTALYATLTGVFHSVLRPYNIDASMGRNMLAAVWLATAFALGSGFFWTISVCCCSGKSGQKKVKVEKTPYTYERVASPYMGASNNSHQMHDMSYNGPAGHGTSGSAFEPYRNK